MTCMCGDTECTSCGSAQGTLGLDKRVDRMLEFMDELGMLTRYMEGFDTEVDIAFQNLITCLTRWFESIGVEVEV